MAVVAGTIPTERMNKMEKDPRQKLVDRPIQRSAYIPSAELRASETGDGKKIISGISPRFNTETTIGGYFKEVIRPRCCTKSLKETDQVALWSHDYNKPMGRRSAKTLRLRQTEEGIEYEIDVPDTTWGRDAWESIKRGDVKGASFGFRATKTRWTEPETAQDLPLCEVLEMQLIEISPTAFPAYADCTSEARSAMSVAGLEEYIRPSDEDNPTDENSTSDEEQSERDDATTAGADAHNSGGENPEPDAIATTVADIESDLRMRRQRLLEIEGRQMMHYS